MTNEDERFEDEMDYIHHSKDSMAWRIFIYIVNRKTATDFTITFDDWNNAVTFFSKEKIVSRTYKYQISWPVWIASIAKARVLKPRGPGMEITKKSEYKIENGKRNVLYLRTLKKINSLEYVNRKYNEKLKRLVDSVVTKALKEANKTE